MLSSQGAVFDRVHLRSGSVDAEALADSRGSVVYGSAGEHGPGSGGQRLLQVELPGWAQIVSIAVFGTLSVTADTASSAVAATLTVDGDQGPEFNATLSAGSSASLSCQHHLRTQGDDVSHLFGVELSWTASAALTDRVAAVTAVVAMWRDPVDPPDEIVP